MAKSSRSKWKKKHNRAKAEALKPALLGRLGDLNHKLDLVSRAAISSVPLQAPCPFFNHGHPELDTGKPLKLAGFTSNVRKGLRGHEGNADGTTGIRSAKRTRAQYHQLPSRDLAELGDDDVPQMIAESGFDTEDGGAPVNFTGKVLPKAADLKRAGNKKQKDGEHGRLVANSGVRRKKQGYDTL